MLALPSYIMPSELRLRNDVSFWSLVTIMPFGVDTKTVPNMHIGFMPIKCIGQYLGMARCHFFMSDTIKKT